MIPSLFYPSGFLPLISCSSLPLVQRVLIWELDKPLHVHLFLFHTVIYPRWKSFCLRLFTLVFPTSGKVTKALYFLSRSASFQTAQATSKVLVFQVGGRDSPGIRKQSLGRVFCSSPPFHTSHYSHASVTLGAAGYFLLF